MGKRLYEADLVKYLGIQVHKTLSWTNFNQRATKINKADAILSEFRKVLALIFLKSAYFAIFDCNSCYVSLFTKH